jgi:hypothetical protein
MFFGPSGERRRYATAELRYHASVCEFWQRFRNSSALRCARHGSRRRPSCHSARLRLHCAWHCTGENVLLRLPFGVSKDIHCGKEGETGGGCGGAGCQTSTASRSATAPRRPTRTPPPPRRARCQARRHQGALSLRIREDGSKIWRESGTASMFGEGCSDRTLGDAAPAALAATGGGGAAGGGVAAARDLGQCSGTGPRGAPTTRRRCVASVHEV